MAKSLMQKAAEDIARQYNITPITGTVDPTKTVQGQVASITALNSPLMMQADTRGRQHAAQRGLHNSTLAGQAAQEAVIGAAVPIANADASLYQQQNLTNQQAQNAALTANAQIGANLGSTAMGLENSNEQQARSLAQQQQQFGVTSGQQQQQIDLSKLNSEAERAARQTQLQQAQQQIDLTRLNSESERQARTTQLQQAQQQIDAQRDQFAKQLGMTQQDMDLKRQSLTQNQQQFLAQLDTQREQLQQQQRQFEAGQQQQITMANLDATLRKELAATEAGFKRAIGADDNIAGAWGTMTQAIQAIQNNPNLEPEAKTTSIQNQIAGFRSFASFWQKAAGSASDVSDLLNFGVGGAPAAAPAPGAAPATGGLLPEYRSPVAPEVLFNSTGSG